MDDVQWQMIPEHQRTQTEARLLNHLGNTRGFLFAVAHNVDNEHGGQI